ncbi:hypothetical protein HPB47_005515 [Ixodes persulcatus]|uniref:Uncharacterized protein n=1 Tax=Ixodes persulcatus TaxID=34615 RepID=A0AC60PCT9_IXOPE|nr:hypothetical protein HPB47_005515 [Ixodes persulcatus]
MFFCWMVGGFSLATYFQSLLTSSLSSGNGWDADDTIDQLYPKLASGKVLPCVIRGTIMEHQLQSENKQGIIGAMAAAQQRSPNKNSTLSDTNGGCRDKVVRGSHVFLSLDFEECSLAMLGNMVTVGKETIYTLYMSTPVRKDFPLRAIYGRLVTRIFETHLQSDEMKDNKQRINHAKKRQATAERNLRHVLLYDDLRSIFVARKQAEDMDKNKQSELHNKKLARLMPLKPTLQNEKRAVFNCSSKELTDHHGPLIVLTTMALPHTKDATGDSAPLVVLTSTDALATREALPVAQQLAFPAERQASVPNDYYRRQAEPGPTGTPMRGVTFPDYELLATICTVAPPNDFPERCRFCGGPCHPRKFCPAAHRRCFSCQKQGHLDRVCESRPRCLRLDRGGPSNPPTVFEFGRRRRRKMRHPLAPWSRPRGGVAVQSPLGSESGVPGSPQQAEENSAEVEQQLRQWCSTPTEDETPSPLSLERDATPEPLEPGAAPLETSNTETDFMDSDEDTCPEADPLDESYRPNNSQLR